jgi:hypothetical protein
MCKLQLYKSFLIASLLLLANIICSGQQLLQTPDVICKGRVSYCVVGMYNKSWIVAYNENEEFVVKKYNLALAEWSKVRTPSIPSNVDQLFFCKQEFGFTAIYLLEKGKRLQWFAQELDTNFLLTKEAYLLTETSYNADADVQISLSENNKHFAFYRVVTNRNNDSTELEYYLYSPQSHSAEWQTINIGETYKTEYNAKFFIWNSGEKVAVCNTLQKNTSMLLSTKIINVSNNQVQIQNVDYRKQEYNYQLVKPNEANHTLHFFLTHAAEERKEVNTIVSTTYQVLENKLAESSCAIVPKLTNKKTKVEAFTNFLPRNMVQKSDGSILLILEYFDVQELLLGADVSNNPASQFRVSRLIRKYEYGDVLLLNMTADSVLKVSTIHKNQSSENDSGILSSFALIKLKTSLGIAFNSLDANKTIQFANIAANDVATFKIMNGSNADVSNLLFKKAKQISSTELIVPCEKQNSVSFVKIVF